jgi:hypothetical protein
MASADFIDSGEAWVGLVTTFLYSCGIFQGQGLGSPGLMRQSRPASRKPA